MDADRLSELEDTIERGMQTFLDVGHALIEIREQSLYRLTGFDTFNDYCVERWGWDRHRAQHYIAAAEVVSAIAAAEELGLDSEQVLPMGNTSGTFTSGKRSEPAAPLFPFNERQARELRRLKDGKLMAEVWREVKDEHGTDVTAAKIRAAVDARLGKEQAPLVLDDPEATVRRLQDLAANPVDRIDRARARECMNAVAHAREIMRAIDPAVIPSLDREERLPIVELIRDARTWAERVEAELQHPLRVVRPDDDEA